MVRRLVATKGSRRKEVGWKVVEASTGAARAAVSLVEEQVAAGQPVEAQADWESHIGGSQPA